MRVLSENFERLRSEYEELTEKYAEILGHHNNNQRIKHICKLKDKILVQQKDNLRLKQVRFLLVIGFLIGLYWIFLNYLTKPLSCYVPKFT